MNKTTLSIILSGFLFGSEMARAENENTSGFWVGAGLGAGQLDETSPRRTSTMRAFSAKLDGGYDLNGNFGVYASYDFMQYIPEEHDLHIGTLGIQGRYGLSDRLSLVGKTGVTYPLGSMDNGDFSGTVGLGLEYQLTHAVSMKAGVDYYHDLSLRKQRTGELYQAYWGLNYRFGQPETPMVITEEVEVIKEVPVIQEVPVSDVTVIGDVLFDVGSSELTTTTLLDRVLNVLQDDEALMLRVEGHADSMGSVAVNDALSLQRAQVVAQYFEMKDVLPSRLIVEGVGSSEPVASNETEQGREQNRRVVLIVE
ncbi:OmpA family protein (plasmid) [Vibrio sp. VNB-15]